MIKILLGGSPCTYWSVAKNGREMVANGLGWELFNNYLVEKEKFKPDYFLYENNWSASTEIKEQIQNSLKEKLVRINSNLFSAQNRDRFYVINSEIGFIKDKDISLIDIIDTKEQYKSLSDNEILYMCRNVKGGRTHWDFCFHNYYKNKKSHCITSNFRKGVPYNVLIDNCNRYDNVTKTYKVSNKTLYINNNAYDIPVEDGDYVIRKFHRKEICRLQTIPDEYCDSVSYSQALKCLGNGWTANVIIYLLSIALDGVNRDEELNVVSMYDGIGTGLYCLKQLGFHNIHYFSYEIDKYAIEIAMKNHPEIIQCGNAFSVLKD